MKELLAAGKLVAFVTDAGTPAVSDPGSRLVSFIRIEVPGAHIVAVPGPSAVSSALSIAGVSADQFTFLGYPPHRKGREKFFKDLLLIQARPLVIYESPHRLAKTFANLAATFGAETRLVVCRELTKVHEEVFDGSVRGAAEHFTGERSRGEFVIIVP